MAVKNITLLSPSGQVKLVPPSSKDVESEAAIRSHPETIRYLPFMAKSWTPEQISALREKRASDETVLDFSVYLCGDDSETTGNFVGIACLYSIDARNDSCYIGLFIEPTHFRGGLGTEVLYTLMQHAFEDADLHMHRLVYHTGRDNMRMRGWLEKVAGVAEEFSFKSSWKCGPGEWVDSVGYTVFDADWRERVKTKLRTRIEKGGLQNTR